MERESTSRLTLDDVCGKEPKNFKKDRLFQNHYRTHAEEKFVCKEYPSVWSGGPENTFNTKKQLSSHIHQYHKNNKDCDQCSKSFSTSTNRIAHEATHIVTCLSVNLVTKFTLTRPLIRNTWRIVLEVKHQLSHFIAMTVTKRFQEIVISQGTWEHILVSSLIHNNVINQS